MGREPQKQSERYGETKDYWDKWPNFPHIAWRKLKPTFVLAPCLTWPVWGGTVLVERGTLILSDVTYPYISMCPGVGQGSSRGSVGMQRPEVGEWRPVRSGSLIFRGNGNVGVL